MFNLSQITNKELSVKDVQAERLAKLSGGMRDEFYFEGLEPVLWSEGYKKGTGTVTKELDLLKLTLSGNTTSTADVTVNSDNPIDLTKIDTIFYEISATGTETRNTDITLSAVTTKNQDNYFDTSKKVVRISQGVPIERSVHALNVSSLTGLHYVKAKLNDASSSLAIDATLNVFAVWGESLNPTTKTKDGLVAVSPMLAKDLQGGNVNLTATIDNEGKAVLRTIDAAPFAYDPVTDSKRVQSVRDYTEVLLVNNLSIRDTTWRVTDSPLSDGSYAKLAIEIYSGLDQPVIVQLLSKSSTVGNLNTFKGIDGVKKNSVTIPASFSSSLSETLWIDDWEPLKFGRAGLYLQFRCSTAPTSGFISIKIIKTRV